MALRRRVLRPGEDDGLVAVYDALLFLMVVVLISVGMFLYSARTITDGGHVSDDFYQHQADTQLIMVEGLSINDTLEMPIIGRKEFGAFEFNESIPLDQVEPNEDAYTVKWLLESYCKLRYRSEQPLPPISDTVHYQYNLTNVTVRVNDFFEGSVMHNRSQAWMFLYNGELVLFGSETVTSVTELPDNRWASTGNYTSPSKRENEYGQSVPIYTAELSYFYWFP
jgi:hypothetical protein